MNDSDERGQSLCEACGRVLKDDAAFCDLCGAQVTSPWRPCTNCNRLLKSDARFCDVCGTPVLSPLPAKPLNHQPEPATPSPPVVMHVTPKEEIPEKEILEGVPEQKTMEETKQIENASLPLTSGVKEALPDNVPAETPPTPPLTLPPKETEEESLEEAYGTASTQETEPGEETDTSRETPQAVPEKTIALHTRKKKVAMAIIGAIAYIFLPAILSRVLPGLGALSFNSLGLGTSWINPAIVIPMLLGFLFGSFTGFTAGFLGVTMFQLFGVVTGGLPFSQVSWIWGIGLGLTGAITGLANRTVTATPFTGVRNRLKIITAILFLPVAAAVIGVSVAAGANYAYQGSIALLIPYVLTGLLMALNAIMFLPPALTVYRLVFKRKTGPLRFEDAEPQS